MDILRFDVPTAQSCDPVAILDGRRQILILVGRETVTQASLSSKDNVPLLDKPTGLVDMSSLKDKTGQIAEGRRGEAWFLLPSSSSSHLLLT